MEVLGTWALLVESPDGPRRLAPLYLAKAGLQSDGVDPRRAPRVSL